jgi:hypothetical protein
MHILDDIFSIKAKTIFGFEGKKWRECRKFGFRDSQLQN